LYMHDSTINILNGNTTMVLLEPCIIKLVVASYMFEHQLSYFF